MTFDEYIAAVRPVWHAFAQEKACENACFESVLGDAEQNDGITGATSHSYTHSRANALTNLADGAMFDDRFIAHVQGWGWSASDVLADGPEWADVLLRIAALEYAADETEYCGMVEEAANALFEESPEDAVALYGNLWGWCDPYEN